MGFFMKKEGHERLIINKNTRLSNLVSQITLILYKSMMVRFVGQVRMLRDNGQSDAVKIMQGRWRIQGKIERTKRGNRERVRWQLFAGRLNYSLKKIYTERSHYPDDLKSMVFVVFSETRKLHSNERRIDVTKSRKDMSFEDILTRRISKH